MRNQLFIVVFAVIELVAGTAPGRAQGRDDPRPAFDVASIKLNINRDAATMRVLRNGIDYVRQSVRTLIAEAYDVTWQSISSPDARIVDRLNRGSYNISARADRESSHAQLMAMLQTLLAERFRLVIRRDARVEQIYRLGPGPGGPHLKESAGDGAAVFVPLPNGGVECRNMRMADFVRYLTGRMGRIVVDATRLNGRYDFTLRLASVGGSGDARDALTPNPIPEATKAAAFADWTSSSIFADVQTQLGLKLDDDRASVDHIVVDRLEAPTDD